MSRFDVEKFESPPDPDLVCCICQCVLDGPVESPCRHVFCKICIETWLRHNKNCPTCRTRLKKRHLKPILPIVKNMLNRLLMFCDFRENGCEEKIMLEIYEKHTNECDYKMVQCKYEKCKVNILKKYQKQHEEELCEHREKLCTQVCGLMIPISIYDDHDCVEELRKYSLEQYALVDTLKKKVTELNSLTQELNQQIDNLRQEFNSRTRTDSFSSWSSISDDNLSNSDMSESVYNYNTSDNEEPNNQGHRMTFEEFDREDRNFWRNFLFENNNGNMVTRSRSRRRRIVNDDSRDAEIIDVVNTPPGSPSAESTSTQDTVVDVVNHSDDLDGNHSDSSQNSGRFTQRSDGFQTPVTSDSSRHSSPRSRQSFHSNSSHSDSSFERSHSRHRTPVSDRSHSRESLRGRDSSREYSNSRRNSSRESTGRRSSSRESTERRSSSRESTERRSSSRESRARHSSCETDSARGRRYESDSSSDTLVNHNSGDSSVRSRSPRSASPSSIRYGCSTSSSNRHRSNHSRSRFYTSSRSSSCSSSSSHSSSRRPSQNSSVSDITESEQDGEHSHHSNQSDGHYSRHSDENHFSESDDENSQHSYSSLKSNHSVRSKDSRHTHRSSFSLSECSRPTRRLSRHSASSSPSPSASRCSSSSSDDSSKHSPDCDDVTSTDGDENKGQYNSLQTMMSYTSPSSDHRNTFHSSEHFPHLNSSSTQRINDDTSERTNQFTLDIENEPSNSECIMSSDSNANAAALTEIPTCSQKFVKNSKFSVQKLSMSKDSASAEVIAPSEDVNEEENCIEVRLNSGHSKLKCISDRGLEGHDHTEVNVKNSGIKRRHSVTDHVANERIGSKKKRKDNMKLNKCESESVSTDQAERKSSSSSSYHHLRARRGQRSNSKTSTVTSSHGFHLDNVDPTSYIYESMMDTENYNSDDDSNWEASSSSDESDTSISEEEVFDNESDYEVQIPKTAGELLAEYASDSSDDSWRP